MPPLISVLVPVYNVEKYLSRCLESLLAQTYPHWEAICVNDGSPDNSEKILAHYSQADSRIKVITQANGGLSAARNVALKHATGEYIVYLDSDDFIHPQTLEIALTLAQTNNTPLVSWYKDKYYRPMLLLLRNLGFKVDGIKPCGYKKRFNAEQVKQVVTDDVISVLTEKSHPKNIPFPIKHFYVWRFLIAKSLLNDIKFIEGITFEDFPWLSEVVLKNPRTTITHLPFYYYYPNAHSIDLSSKRLRKLLDWITGAEHSFKLYQQKASEHQRTQWSKNCLWPVLHLQIRNKLKGIGAEEDKTVLKKRLGELMQLGVFNAPPSPKYQRVKQDIERYINA